LIGTIEGHGTDELLVDLALDETERESVRIAAIGALGERRSPLIGDTLWALVQDDDLVGAHAALALQTTEPSPTRQRGNGLTVAQLVLAGGLDGQLSRGGRGETGGVASLLVSLGSALGSQPTVDHVVTIGRGSVADALVGPIIEETEPWSYGMIAVGDPDRPVDGAQDAWEHLPAVERGVRRVIRLAGPIDMLHLRMADVGTIAGATVAETAGVPTCFSLAPDPHNVLQSLQSRGELDAASLQRLDTDQHLWFRARLVEGLSRRADRLALFPRATSFRFIDQIDPFDRTGRPRTAVVAEGIDLDAIRRAETDVRRVDPTPAIVRRLNERITGDRRGLPLMVSAGRLHPVKGMERVVAAWASDPWLHTSCNLVIVGGDLDQPSASEQGVLDAIESTLVRHPRARPGLVLLGGQAHADVARLLVSATQGHGDAWAPGGVYVDGALKEEFGLAVLEAMAAGLPVVAPSTGGPSTYVTPGDTGVLVDPDDDLAAAMTGAFRLVGRPGRAERARNLVETRYSIDTMAEQLLTLYLAGAA
jgi:glycosyltransferase involved in cell wall biosynthesis